MSGIAGIIHFDGAPVEPGLVEKMTGAMAYRGPDGIDHWVKGSVALGQCMLRTTPESLEEHQPLTNEDESLVLVMDGRVDNWEELRRELLARGAVLRNRSDAELVLRAYETWGRDCLSHIDGDFALVIWDARRQRGLLRARPHGQQAVPLPLGRQDLRLRLGTARDSGAAVGAQRHPTKACWRSSWRPNGIPGTRRSGRASCGWWRRTAWCVDAGGPRPEQYWAPDLWATLPYTSDEDYIEHYRETAHRHRPADVAIASHPVACEVSGGLDSSAVLCMAEYLRRSGKLPAPGIAGYTLDFTDDGEANELDYARAVGDHLGVCIDEVQPSAMPLSWYAEHARSRKDFPGYPNGVMHHGLYQQAHLRGANALLTGLGGDQWLQGSVAYYAEELAVLRWPSLRDCFVADARAFGTWRATAMLLQHGCLPLLPETLKAALRPLVRQRNGRRAHGGYWLSADMRARLQRQRALPRASEIQPVRRGQRALLQALYYGFDTLGRELCERLAARSGIELRHPLHAWSFVQHAFSTPERMRLRGGRDKYVHVNALQGIVPQRILDRTTKAGFAGVFSAYLNRMKATLTDDLPRARAEWLDREGMARLFSPTRTTRNKAGRTGCCGMSWPATVSCRAIVDPVP